MPGMLRRIRFENKGQGYKMRCNYCKRPKGELYQAQFAVGGPTYMLCPGNCLVQAQANYKARVEKGILPTQETKGDSIFSDTQEFSDQDGIDKD